MRVLLLLLLLLPGLTFAESSVWKVAKGDRYLYLAGTMHLLKTDDYPLPREFEYAYKNSRFLVFEADLEELESKEFQKLIATTAMYPAGQSVASVLKPDVLARLKAYCEKKGMPFEAVQQMKAGLLTVTISVMAMAEQGLASEGVDHFYYKRAKQDGKPISALESMRQQVSFIADMGKGNESALVEQTLNDIDEMPEMIVKLRKIWREGDVDGMASEVVIPMKEATPNLYIQLLAQRNVNWIPNLEAMMQTAEVEMVLVGAAHMAGEHGLHKLLRAKGYTITKVKAPI